MKKFVPFLFLLTMLFPAKGSGQSNALAPQGYRLRTINSALLEIAIGNVNSPVYLNLVQDVKIIYRWYDTRMAFGEKVRISEDPIYTEECTYSNGRLSMYKKESIFYKIHWSIEGEITKIVLYNSNGDELRSYSLSTYKWYWTSYEQLVGEKLGGDIFIKDVLLAYKYNSSEKRRLDGYRVDNFRFDGSYDLKYKTVESTFGKIRGQISKGWKRYENEKKVADVFPDGRIKKDSNFRNFDVSDQASCDFLVEY